MSCLRRSGGDFQARRSNIGEGSFAGGRGERHCIQIRSEEHTSELQSLMRISYAVFCLTEKTCLSVSRIYNRSFQTSQPSRTIPPLNTNNSRTSSTPPKHGKYTK